MQKKNTANHAKPNIQHDEVLLSKIISNHSSIKVTFLDGELIVDRLRWHTSNFLGLFGGKVVNKSALKYWEISEEIK